MIKTYGIKILVFFITLIIIACAAKGPLYIDSPLPKNGDALVYIYRLSNTPPLARDACFYINDVNIVDLSTNGYAWFHVPGGQYVLKQKWPLGVNLGAHDIVIPVKWHPRQKVYYRLSSSFAHHGLYSEHKWRIDEVPEDQAINEIRNCRLQPVFGFEKLFEKLN